MNMSNLYSFITFSLIIYTFTFLGVRTQEASNLWNHYFCPNTTTFQPNSTYQSNLHQALSFLTNNATRASGYYNTSVGQNPGTVVYASFLCRPDISTDECQECVGTASKALTQQYCTVEKIAVIRYDLCILRYSNVSFFGILDQAPTVAVYVMPNITDTQTFNQLVQKTMYELVNEASDAPTGAEKFSAKQVNFTNFHTPYTLYNLVQCEPALSSSDCDVCLRQVVSFLSSCCSGNQGLRLFNPSCNIRYELYPFYNSSALPPAQSPELSPPTPSPELSPPTPSKGKESNTIRIVIITALVPFVFALIVFIIICVYMRTRKARVENEVRPSSKDGEEINMKAESLQYDFETIKIATDDFSESNRLGEGGFGPVYRGRLSDGQNIAVKRLSRNSDQGDLEFKNEVLFLAKLQHRNVVRLFGFCLDGQEKLLLYEFVCNASLDRFIFDQTKREELDWKRRYKIISGISRGLLYLHEESRQRIIHRDLKTSNILLDEEMNPKISDFGLATLFGVDQSQGNTGRIVGTYGYMAPEYAKYGQFSVKSDVFSFGVLMLEILSGEKNTRFYHGDDIDHLLSFIWRNWRAGKAQKVIDPTMRNGSINEIMRCIQIALMCVQQDAAVRPTMSSVVLMLNNFSMNLPRPLRPAYFINTNRSLPSDNNLGTACSIQSRIDDSVSILYPR